VSPGGVPNAGTQVQQEMIAIERGGATSTETARCILVIEKYSLTANAAQ
jgi:hypothetical protein